MANFNELVFAAANETKTYPDNPGFETTSTNVMSPFFSGRRGHLHPDVSRALALICGWIDSSDFAVVKIGDKDYACECAAEEDKIALVHMSLRNGKLEAAKQRTASGRLTSFDQISTTEPVDCAPIMACLITFLWDSMDDGSITLPESMSRGSIMDKFSEWIADGKDPAKIPEGLNDAAVSLSETIKGAVEDGTIRLSLPADGNIDQITRKGLAPLKTGEVIFGTANVLTDDEPVKAKAVTTLKSAMARYQAFAGGFDWTDEERALIGGGESFEDDAVVADEVLRMADLFVGTYNTKVPIKNFQFVGPTGIGKSVSVAMLSTILGIPLLRFTCNDKTETEDFLSTLIPDTTENSISPDSITPSDMVYDPDGTWKLLTGESREGVTEEECMEMYLKVKQSGGEGTRFTHVISNYAKALINGYIVEVQEASRIRQQGALAGLNECDRPGSFLRLMDGTYVRRHENAMVVFTDNSGFDSCHDIEPSVLRRMGVKFIAKDLDKETLIGRIKQNTGFDNKALLDKMYTIWTKTKDFCREQGLTSGSIGTVELENWVKVFMVLGRSSLQYSWEITVANKCINNSDDSTDDLDALIGAMTPEFQVA